MINFKKVYKVCFFITINKRLIEVNMRIPKYINNWLSIGGIFLSINSFLLIVVLFIISVTMGAGSSYWGIYIYIVLPALLVIGLILIPIGMLIKYRKSKGVEAESILRWPLLDLNNKKQRKSFAVISSLTLAFILISAAGSYKAFHYTESVAFCGKLCHSVMNPEYVTYLNSPHARVKCVECHVGEGADWYVKSKLSGLYQVYSVTFNKYSRPIPTPIKSLRPARETCENCHWPEKFYARKLRSQRSFLTDSLNTDWNISMLMKVGPEYSPFGLSEGIHWHINKDVKIEYISSTNDRESIPWVKYTNLKTGKVQIFQDTENKLDKKGLDTLAANTRTMDCMDCHNRPSHSYKSAPDYIDNALLSGIIPKNLPFIKKASMETLKETFATTDAAMHCIRDSINSFYKGRYPKVYSENKNLIDKSIAGIQEEFKKNNFPEMNVNNSSYLNHIGHLESEGCFRCHSGRHKNEAGQVISKDCNLCHTIVGQGSSANFKSVSLKDTLEFKHPVDIGNSWKESACSECHKVLY
jgi:hypothetical protein